MWKTEATGVAHVETAVRQCLPPCEIKCPINEDIQRTNVLISLLPEDMDSAREGIIQISDYLYERNPFFNICGYICGICELECNYLKKGGAIKRRLWGAPNISTTYNERLPAFSTGCLASFTWFFS